MFNFFISLMIIGISLIVISIILMLFDYKKAVMEKERVDSKIASLEELLGDADQIIQELNRFSDYVVEKIDEKSTEIKTILNESENVVSKLKQVDLKDNDESNDEVEIVPLSKSEPQTIQKSNNKPEQVIELVKKDSLKYSASNKQSEVIRLFEEGLSDNEIARRLNMGKGEIQLIIGMNLHRLKA